MKLNLGSGAHYLKGYVNIDYQPGKKVDVCEDFFEYLKELEDNSVDEILCEHVLEHLTPGEGTHLVEECFRVLKPGGFLIAECPDIHDLAQRYIDPGLNEPGISFTEFMNGVFGQIGGVSVRQGHIWGYTTRTLGQLLKDAGFEIVGCPKEEYRWKWYLSIRIKGIKCNI